MGWFSERVACNSWVAGDQVLTYPGSFLSGEGLSSSPGHRCRPIPLRLATHFDEMLFSIGINSLTARPRGEPSQRPKEPSSRRDTKPAEFLVQPDVSVPEKLRRVGSC